MRFDSGFWSNDTIAALGRLNVRYTMAVRTSNKGPAKAIAGDRRDAWDDIDYTDDGEARSRSAPTTGGVSSCAAPGSPTAAKPKLWPDWRHHAFLTDLDDDAVTVDAFHRQHAVVELAIRDLKEGAGLEHVPSGNFHANSAWLQCAVLAHNLIRWTATSASPASTISLHRRPHHPHPTPRPPRPLALAIYQVAGWDPWKL